MSGEWLACAEPERPHDALTRWHLDSCRGCHLKALVRLRQEPDSHAAALVAAMTAPREAS